MNLPAQISKSTLAKLGVNDTHAVRVILHDVHNPSPCRIRCRTRQYIFERNGALMAHALDIPMSVWMAGVGKGRFRDNRAVCDDFRDVSQKFTVQIIQLQETPREESSGTIGELHRLISSFDAPDEVQHALAMLESGASTEELSAYVDNVIGHLDSTPPAPEVEENASQARARKMREAKAAKKLQLQNA